MASQNYYRREAHKLYKRIKNKKADNKKGKNSKSKKELQISWAYQFI